jgi:peptidoglycan hydrolase CwlO-like protein
MATNLELEKIVNGAEKQIDEMRGAIRRLASEQNNLLTVLTGLNDELLKFKGELAQTNKNLADLALKQKK